MAQQYYLRDPDTGDRVPRRDATPGRMYEVRYEAGGAEAGESRWGYYRVGAGGHEEFEPESGRGGTGRADDGLLERGWRGVKQGARAVADTAYGIPALGGDPEDVERLLQETEASRRAYELETPLRDQVAARRPLFGAEGRLTPGRAATLGGEAVPWLGAFLLANWGLAAVARGGAAASGARAAEGASVARRAGAGAQRVAGDATGAALGGGVQRGAIASASVGGSAAGAEGIERAVEGGSQPGEAAIAGRIAAGVASPIHALTGGILGPLWNRRGAGIPKVALETITEAVEGGGDEFAAQAATRHITLQPYDFRQMLEGAGLEAIGGGVAAAGAQSVQGIAVKGFDKWLDKDKEDGGSQAQKESQYDSFSGLLFGKGGEDGGTDFVNPSRSPESLGPRGGGAEEAIEIFSAVPENTPPAEAEARQKTTKDLWTQLLAVEKSLPPGVQLTSYIGGATSAELVNGTQMGEVKIPGIVILSEFGLKPGDEVAAQKIKEDFLTSVVGQAEASTDPHLRQVWDVMRYGLEPKSIGDSIVVGGMNRAIALRWGEEYAVLGENIAAVDDPDADLPTQNVLRRLSAMVKLARLSKQEKEAGRDSLMDFHREAYEQATGRGRESAPFQWLMNAHHELKQSPAYRAAAANVETIRPVDKIVDAADMLDLIDKTYKMAEEIEGRDAKSPEGQAAKDAAAQPTAPPPAGADKPMPLRRAQSEAALLMSLQASFGARSINAAPLNLQSDGTGVPELAVPRRTKRGSISGEFSPDRSGVVILYEDSNGKNFLAHGAARYRAAVDQQREGRPVSLPAIVFRARDGITQEDMAGIADMMNIVSGRATAPEIAAAMRNPKIAAAVATAAQMADSQTLRDIEEIYQGLTPEQIRTAAVKGIPDRMAAAVAAADLTPEQKTAALTLKESKDANTAAAAKEIIARIGHTETPAESKPASKKGKPGGKKTDPKFSAPPKSKVAQEAADTLSQEYIDEIRRHAYRQLTDANIQRAAMRDLAKVRNVSLQEMAILQAIFALDNSTRQQATGNVPSSNDRWRKMFAEYGGGSIQRGFQRPGGNKELRDLRRAIGLFWVAREAHAMGIDTASGVKIMGMFDGSFVKPGQPPRPFNTGPGMRGRDGTIYLAMAYVDQSDNVNVREIGNIAEYFSHEAWHLFFMKLPLEQRVRMYDDAKSWLSARGHAEQFLDSQVQESLRMGGYRPPKPLSPGATAEDALRQQAAIDRYKSDITDERMAYIFQYALHHGFAPVRPAESGIGELAKELFTNIGNRFLRMGWLTADQAINALYRGSAREMMQRKKAVGSARALRRALTKPLPGRRDIVRVNKISDLIVSVGGDTPEDFVADGAATADEGKFIFVPPKDVLGSRFDKKILRAEDMYVAEIRKHFTPKNSSQQGISSAAIRFLTENHPESIEKIWRETGMIFGVEPYPKLRVEIPDYSALHFDKMKGLRVGDMINLETIADWPELFNLYPHARKIPIRVTPDGSRGNAGNIGTRGIGMPHPNTPRKKPWGLTLIHEVQHYVQDHAEFSTGYFDSGGRFGNYGNSSRMYWNAAGEAEAREASNRFGKDAQWRALNPPKWDGIPADKLIHKEYRHNFPGFLISGAKGQPPQPVARQRVSIEDRVMRGVALTPDLMKRLKRMKPHGKGIIFNNILQDAYWRKYGKDPALRDLIRTERKFGNRYFFGSAGIRRADIDTFGRSLDDDERGVQLPDLTGDELLAAREEYNKEFGTNHRDGHGFVDDDVNEWVRQGKPGKDSVPPSEFDMPRDSAKFVSPWLGDRDDVWSAAEEYSSGAKLPPKIYEKAVERTIAPAADGGRHNPNAQKIASKLFYDPIPWSDTYGFVYSMGDRHRMEDFEEDAIKRALRHTGLNSYAIYLPGLGSPRRDWGPATDRDGGQSNHLGGCVWRQSRRSRNRY